MSAEFWAIIGVGVAVVGLQWRMFDRLSRRIDALQADMATVKERLTRIEGWIEDDSRREQRHDTDTLQERLAWRSGPRPTGSATFTRRAVCFMVPSPPATDFIQSYFAGIVIRKSLTPSELRRAQAGSGRPKEAWRLRTNGALPVK